jgi:hypothetical protein
MKEIKHTILYCVCENFCDFIFYGYGSDFLARYGSGSGSASSYDSGSGSTTLQTEDEIYGFQVLLCCRRDLSRCRTKWRAPAWTKWGAPWTFSTLTTQP